MVSFAVENSFFWKNGEESQHSVFQSDASDVNRKSFNRRLRDFETIFPLSKNLINSSCSIWFNF